MKTHSCFRLLTNALTGAILFTTTALQAEEADQVKVTDLMTKDLVNFPGKEVTMFTVDYPPGGADPVHRHNASAFVYVLEGSIVTQMKGEEKVTLHPGDTFYEDPAGIHLSGKMRATRNPRHRVGFLFRAGQGFLTLAGFLSPTIESLRGTRWRCRRPGNPWEAFSAV
jgi:quercetin dioxygenase-like cupin family protein